MWLTQASGKGRVVWVWKERWDLGHHCPESVDKWGGTLREDSCLLNICSLALPSPGLSVPAEAPVVPLDTVVSRPQWCPARPHTCHLSRELCLQPRCAGKGLGGGWEDKQTRWGPDRSLLGRGSGAEGAKRGRAWGLPKPLPTLCPGRAHLPT